MNRLRKINQRRLANTKYTNIVSNETVLADFEKEIGEKNKKYYKKSTTNNIDLETDGYTGFYFMKANNDESKPIKKDEIYAIEIHTFYKKLPEEVLKEENEKLYNKNENNYERRRKLNSIIKILNTLPTIKTLIYKATFKNSNIPNKLDFDAPIITHSCIDNISPGEILDEIGINPDNSSSFQHFTFNNKYMIILSGATSISTAILMLNAPGNIIDKA